MLMLKVIMINNSKEKKGGESIILIEIEVSQVGSRLSVAKKDTKQSLMALNICWGCEPFNCLAASHSS